MTLALSVADACLARHRVRVLGASGPMLVFVPGFGGSQASWEPVAMCFTGTHRVVLMDLVDGHPLDPGDGPAYDNLWAHGTDLLEVLGALDARDVTVVGHGLAGLGGLLASIQAPRLFKQLVLVCPSARFLNDPSGYKGGFTRDHLNALMELMARDFDAFAEVLSGLAYGDQADPRFARELAQRMATQDREAFGVRLRQRLECDHRADLAHCPVPCVVLQSHDDHYVPPTATEYLVSQLRHGTLHWLDASGHCPHLTHPEVVECALRAVLHA